MGMGDQRGRYVIAPKRGEVWLCELNPVVGSEIRKTRPALVVSPDELNDNWPSCIIAPMTTGGHPYPFRVACRFQGTQGQVVIDQLRAVDTARLTKRLGTLPPSIITQVLAVTREMFVD